MSESRTNKTEQSALERVIRRAIAHRNWGLVRDLFHELGILFEESAEARPSAGS